jgi:hypothetical protein
LGRGPHTGQFVQNVAVTELPALSPGYHAAYEAFLGAVGAAPGLEPAELAAFYPMVGHAYAGDLLVVGRAVNGWVDRVTVDELRDPGARHRLAEAARRTSLGQDGCPMGWVTWRWSRPAGEYSTGRSAFWRHVRAVLAAVDPASADDPAWSSRLAWTNLVKLAPWSGGNPGGALLDRQREAGPALLAHEVADLAPARVLVLTGRWWFEPFAERLGLDVRWRDGLVEGVAHDAGRRWVVAGHPQGKPRAMLDEVFAAFR